MEKKICAIILNYNSSDDVNKCLYYLAKQTFPNFTSLVVDNNSNKDELDKIITICKKYSVELIKCSENKGFSAGNNVGLKRCTELNADYALIINPDVELRNPQYVEIMCSYIERDKDIVVAASNVVLPSGRRQNPSREPKLWEELLWPVQGLRGKLDRNFKWYLTQNKTDYCEKVSGCCFFVEMNFIRENNYFDEGVFLYCEEAILSKMVKNSSKKMYYVSELTAYHMHFEENKGNNSDRRKLMYNSRCYYWDHYSEYRTVTKFILKHTYRHR